MKYEQVDWSKLLPGLLKAKSMRKVDLAGKMGQSQQALGNMFDRIDLKVPSVQALSRGLGEDLMVHLLAKETQTVLEKAREVGVTTGPENELLAWQSELQLLRVEIEAQQKQLAAQAREIQDLDAIRKTLEAELRAERAESKQQEAREKAELQAKGAELDRLRAEVRQLEYDKKLEVSVLQAKLDVLLKGEE